MKTTKELLNIDPTIFKTMLYEDVLHLKLQAAQDEYKQLSEQRKDLGIEPGTYDKASEINQDMIKYKKAITAIVQLSAVTPAIPMVIHIPANSSITISFPS